MHRRKPFDPLKQAASFDSQVSVPEVALFRHAVPVCDLTLVLSVVSSWVDD